MFMIYLICCKVTCLRTPFLLIYETTFNYSLINYKRIITSFDNLIFFECRVRFILGVNTPSFNMTIFHKNHGMSPTSHKLALSSYLKNWENIVEEVKFGRYVTLKNMTAEYRQVTVEPDPRYGLRLTKKYKGLVSWGGICKDR